ncbi:MAG: sugar phosphate isomerase/epimerase family protein [Caldicoprobacterales bacterium]|jgi:sugar phosphate isomerase/epimerase|nr:sugar phosphate isomerase/epimerase [Clostridiales bacterium]
MNYNFVLSAFADEIDPDLKVQMEVLKQHGIQYIEMRGVNGRNITDYTLEEVKRIKNQLDEQDFRISAVGSPIGKIQITDDFTPHLEKFRHTLEIAKILETDYIRMFSFYIPREEDPARYREEVLNRWKAFLGAAEGSGITLLHENEKDIYGDTPERCLDLAESLNSESFRLIFDPANFIQCDVETYPKAFTMLQDHIVYLHIKDALFSNHQVVPAGQGDGKLKEILDALKDKGFRGFLSLEPHLANFTGFSELETDVITADLPDGGPREFAVAAHALKSLL